jgi:hypothetical protein
MKTSEIKKFWIFSLEVNIKNSIFQSNTRKNLFFSMQENFYTML